MREYIIVFIKGSDKGLNFDMKCNCVKYDDPKYLICYNKREDSRKGYTMKMLAMIPHENVNYIRNYPYEEAEFK